MVGTDKIQVCNLSPFTDKDFKIRCLADRVKDLPVLIKLFPDIPKDNAFGKYWSQSNDTVQQANPLDYIQSTLIMTIPGYVLYLKLSFLFATGCKGFKIELI